MLQRSRHTAWRFWALALGIAAIGAGVGACAADDEYAHLHSWDSLPKVSATVSAPSESNTPAPAATQPPRDDRGWRWRRPSATFDPAASATIGESRRTGLKVNALIGGVQGRFLVDTGASRTLVSTEFAERAKLPTSPEGTFESGSDAILSRGRICESVVLGPMTTTRLIVAEVRDDALGSVLGPSVDGMFGVDVLRLMVGEFDFKAGTLTIRDPAQPVPGVSADDWISVEMATGRPCVRCTFEGDHEGLFLLDTGSDGGVQFFSRAVREFNLLEGRRVSERTIRSVYGRGTAGRGTLDWIQLGPHRIEKPQADFFMDEPRRSPLTGQIGRTMLRDFVLVTDLGNRRIALKKPQPAAR